ncbi:hypothetical protein U1708_02650 [Sphingomonas sp. ZB1N12]
MPINVGRKKIASVSMLNRASVVYLITAIIMFDLTDTMPWPNGSAHASSFGKLKYISSDFSMSFVSHANFSRRSKFRESHERIIDTIDKESEQIQNIYKP